MKKDNEKRLTRLFNSRIARGVKFLDKRFTRGYWLGKINPMMLDMSSSDTCICGQVFADHWHQFVAEEEEKENWDNVGVKYGFSIEDEIQSLRGWGQKSWDLLGYLWSKKLIELKFKNRFKA